MRSDRNLYSKNLIEAQDEIGDMKRKFKIMQHQIEQLKEEIQAKDMALVKEHFDHMARLCPLLSLPCLPLPPASLPCLACLFGRPALGR